MGTNRSEVYEIDIDVESLRYQIQKLFWEFGPVCHHRHGCSSTASAYSIFFFQLFFVCERKQKLVNEFLLKIRGLMLS
jgi:hypothetical protein